MPHGRHLPFESRQEASVFFRILFAIPVEMVEVARHSNFFRKPADG